jgi:hypothetical protein
LSIPLPRKMRSKKRDFFQGDGLSFLEMAGVESLKNLKMWTFDPFFCEELLISQNRDGQPTVKFYRQHDVMHIYRLVPRNKHFYNIGGRERYKKP